MKSAAASPTSPEAELCLAILAVVGSIVVNFAIAIGLVMVGLIGYVFKPARRLADTVYNELTAIPDGD